MRLRTLGRFLKSSPAEMAWVVRLVLLAAILPVLIRRVPLPRLLERLTPDGGTARPAPDARTIVRRTDRLLRQRVGMFRPNCLERSLLLYHLLRRAGLPVDFCLGVRTDLPGPATREGRQLHGHAWVARGDEALFESSERVATVYRETWRFPAGGPPSPSPASGPARTGGDAAAAHRAALLRACARTRVRPADHAAIRRLAEDVDDWSSLIRESRLHGMLPLAARNLEAHAAGLIPDPELRTLRRLDQAQSMRNAVMFRVLQDVLEKLEGARLPAMAVKGPTLAIRAYGHLSLRQFADLDVLIREDEADAVRDVLAGAGYRHVRTDAHSKYLKVEAPAGFAIDLQWGLAPDWYRFPVDLRGIWTRARRIPLAGVEILQPASEDQALLLCAHAGKHCWSKLGWIADLNEFLRVEGEHMDWTRLFEQARAVGGYRTLLLGLALRRDVLGSGLPARVEQLIARDPRAARLAARVIERLNVGAEGLAGTCGGFATEERWRFHMSAREQLSDRLAYLRHLLRRRGRRRRLARSVLASGRRGMGRVTGEA